MVGQLWAGNGARPDVGEQPKFLADLQKPLLRAYGRTAPLRTTDGTKEDGIGSTARLQSGIGEGLAVLVDRTASEITFCEEPVRLSHKRFQNINK